MVWYYGNHFYANPILQRGERSTSTDIPNGDVLCSVYANCVGMGYPN